MIDQNDQATQDLLGDKPKRRSSLRSRAGAQSEQPDPAALSDKKLLQMYAQDFKKPTLPKDYWTRLGAELHSRRFGKSHATRSARELLGPKGPSFRSTCRAGRLSV